MTGLEILWFLIKSAIVIFAIALFLTIFFRNDYDAHGTD